jgi:hypothetical protein
VVEGRVFVELVGVAVIAAKNGDYFLLPLTPGRSCIWPKKEKKVEFKLAPFLAA